MCVDRINKKNKKPTGLDEDVNTKDNKKSASLPEVSHSEANSDELGEQPIDLHSETTFALGLLLLLQQNAHDSIVFSPLSIALGLSLLFVAADRETKDQIRKALGVGSDYYSRILKSIVKANREKRTTVHMANAVFVQSKFPIKKSYLNEIKKSFKSTAVSVDFKEGKTATETINKFIDVNTGGNIRKMVTEDTINPELVAVLTNALWFKAHWWKKFHKSQTTKDYFFNSATSKREIDFLFDERETRAYTENELFQVLQLPYKDKHFALTIFLPKTRYGLKDAMKNLNAKTIQHLMTTASNELGNIKISKFEIKSDLNLKDVLQGMGITKVFEHDADLGKMTNLRPDNKIYLSKVSHKSRIQINEDGTCAAAATTLECFAMCGGECFNFVADHPFLFVITHNKHILFIGTFH